MNDEKKKIFDIVKNGSNCDGICVKCKYENDDDCCFTRVADLLLENLSADEIFTTMKEAEEMLKKLEV